VRSFVVEVTDRQRRRVQRHSVTPRTEPASALLYADVPVSNGRSMRVWGLTPDQVAEAFGVMLLGQLGDAPYRLVINGVPVLEKEVA
jgi:hypothetical protein